MAVTTPVHPLDALGNALRRDILRELRCGPRSVGELASCFPVSRPAVSRHLRVLEDAGLVEPRAAAPHPKYAVRMQGFRPVRDYLDTFWDAALARLEEISREDG